MPILTAETLTLNGPDARAFAHAQLSSDIYALEPGHWQWSAWLNAQGRVRCVLQIAHIEQDTLLLLLRGGNARDMATQLAPYVLRRRVTLTANAPRALVDAPSLPYQEATQAMGNRLLLGMGDHALCLADMPDPDSRPQGTPQAWRLAAITAGQPWLPDSTLESFTAPALGLIQLGAASVDKGCYPGQEIVARLHHRGGNKRHLCKIQCRRGLQAGQALHSNGKLVGQLLDVVHLPDQGDVALAVIQGPTIPLHLEDDDLGPLRMQTIADAK